jgi:uncharacterized protein YecT (DUF1311 family)
VSIFVSFSFNVGIKNFNSLSLLKKINANKYRTGDAKTRKQNIDEIEKEFLIALLKKSQTMWEQYQSSQCEFEASGYQGGSAQPMTKAICEQRMTRNRERELGGVLSNIQ